jgi:hypothetical protein
MATKKQRRRRAKEQRHDYVWVDDEGNELDPEEAAAERREPQARAAGPRRDPQAPSWRRTFKRGAIFAPIMLATVFLLSPDLPLSQKLTQTLLIVAIFVPFSYFLDRFFYRSFQRRADRREQSNGRRGS